MTLHNHHRVSHDLPQSSRAQHYHLCIRISESIGPQSTQPTALHHPGQGRGRGTVSGYIRSFPHTLDTEFKVRVAIFKFLSIAEGEVDLALWRRER